MMHAFTIAAIGSGGKTTALRRLAYQLSERDKTASVLLTAATHMYPVFPPDSRILLTDPDEKVLRAELSRPGIVCAGRTAPEGKLTALTASQLAVSVQTASFILCEADGSRRLPLKLHSEREPVLPPQTGICLITAGLSALGKEAGSCVHRYDLNPVWRKRPDTRIGAKELAFCVLDAVSAVTRPGRQSFDGCLSKDRIRILLNQSDALFPSESPNAPLSVLQKEAFAAMEILRGHGLFCRMGSLLKDSSFLLDWILAPGRLQQPDLSVKGKLH